MKRADWHLRANLFVLLYLLAALGSGIQSALSEEKHLSWLTVHLLLLGAVTNGILTWGEHFVAALLWSRSQGRLRRLPLVLALNAGILGCLVGVEIKLHALVVVSSLVVGGIIFIYVWGIHRSISETLNKRYVGLIRYYQYAGLAIILGISLGTVGVFIPHEELWHSKLALAHVHVNLMGWVGLTIIGTLITFWPTILRTPMHPKAVKFGEKGLRFLVFGVALVIVAAVLDIRVLVAVGDLIYLAGAAVALTPAALVIRQRVPDRASSWMVATGVVGFVVLIALDIVTALQSNSAESFFEAIEDHSLIIFVVWLLPIFLGSLTYLLPMTLGRGPKVNRELEAIINYGWRLRVFLLPISSFLLLFTGFHDAGFAAAGIALGIFLVLAFTTMIRARRYKPVASP
ncbi:MAG: hypothetical protein H7227_08020 [Actinobacteria bacterium]|nr:hypothetical protein [Actinomycetota bacterium]